MDSNLEAFRLASPLTTTSGSANPVVDEQIDSTRPKTTQRQLFIRGPILLPWLTKVAALPGKTPLILGLALHFEAGLAKSKSKLRLTTKLRERFAIPERSARDALKKLEAAGLVSVERQPGRCNVVSILDDG